MKRNQFLFMIASVIAAMLFLAGCDLDGTDFTDNGGSGDTVINLSAIPGVPAPAHDELPVSVISETGQYTGTVSWLPDDNPFLDATVYTATITLTAKAGYTLGGISANSFTVAGATTVTHDADSGVVTAEFPATTAGVYTLGDTGPAGGLIFYIDEADNHTWTYLEVAPESTEGTGIEWGDFGTELGGDAALTGIGDGRAATTSIVSHMDGNTISDTAAQFCDELSHNGYEDWFLPSKDELYAVWDNIVDNGSGANGGVGGFSIDFYWTSSEDDSGYAWTQSFGSDSQPLYSKDSIRPVRAVRAF